MTPKAGCDENRRSGTHGPQESRGTRVTAGFTTAKKRGAQQVGEEGRRTERGWMV